MKTCLQAVPLTSVPSTIVSREPQQPSSVVELSTQPLPGLSTTASASSCPSSSKTPQPSIASSKPVTISEAAQLPLSPSMSHSSVQKKGPAGPLIGIEDDYSVTTDLHLFPAMDNYQPRVPNLASISDFLDAALTDM